MQLRRRRRLEDSLDDDGFEPWTHRRRLPPRPTPPRCGRAGSAAGGDPRGAVIPRRRLHPRGNRGADAAHAELLKSQIARRTPPARLAGTAIRARNGGAACVNRTPTTRCRRRTGPRPSPHCRRKRCRPMRCRRCSRGCRHRRRHDPPAMVDRRGGGARAGSGGSARDECCPSFRCRRAAQRRNCLHSSFRRKASHATQ